MVARKGVFSSIGRASAVATVVAVTLTAVAPSMALAGSAPSGNGVTAGTSGATDISARRRYYRGGGGGAAAVAAFAGIVGTGIAIAASQDRYNDSYGYYGGGGPVYYGGGPAYGYGGGYGGGYGSGVPYFHGHPNAGW